MNNRAPLWIAAGLVLAWLVTKNQAAAAAPVNFPPATPRPPVRIPYPPRQSIIVGDDRWSQSEPNEIETQD